MSELVRIHVTTSLHFTSCVITFLNELRSGNGRCDGIHGDFSHKILPFVLKCARGSTDLLSEGELVGDVAVLESRPFFTGDGFSEWELPESVCIF